MKIDIFVLVDKIQQTAHGNNNMQNIIFSGKGLLENDIYNDVHDLSQKNINLSTENKALLVRVGMLEQMINDKQEIIDLLKNRIK